jgi:hypothetical protein
MPTPRPLPLAVPAVALALALATPAPTPAFSPASRTELAQRAISLMPPSLARQLHKHEQRLLQGVLEGMERCDGTGAHGAATGEAEARLATAVAETMAMIDRRERMADVAQSFGRVAHAAADLAFALNAGPDDPREATFYREFALYVERMFPKMRLTFAGWADPDLARRDVQAFARRTAALAQRDAEAIARSYYPEGRARTAQDFDERSVAFAAASLEASLALTATSRAWLYAWWRAHGDLAGTPHLDPGLVHNPFAPPSGSLSSPGRQESAR